MVNIGHDLNLQNLPPLMAQMPTIHEASIGHELTADALELGFGPAVAAYKAALIGEQHNPGPYGAADPRYSDVAK